ncbi:MAG TPA: hypothetical protein VJ932_03015, partial [Alkalispirochaeta sp.]|nr:hypothetical protein [Alkalispirochaeta sp.]
MLAVYTNLLQEAAELSRLYRDIGPDNDEHQNHTASGPFLYLQEVLLCPSHRAAPTQIAWLTTTLRPAGSAPSARMQRTLTVSSP